LYARKAFGIQETRSVSFRRRALRQQHTTKAQPLLEKGSMWRGLGVSNSFNTARRSLKVDQVIGHCQKYKA
jgi:hypothetical protein